MYGCMDMGELVFGIFTVDSPSHGVKLAHLHAVQETGFVSLLFFTNAGF